MEQSKQTGISPQTTSVDTFSMKIENTNYMVGVHFSRTAKDTGEQNEAFNTGWC